MPDQPCSNCGSPLPVGALFCTQCGTQFAPAEPVTSVEPDAPAAPDPTQVVAPQADLTQVVTPQADPTLVLPIPPASAQAPPESVNPWSDTTSAQAAAPAPMSSPPSAPQPPAAPPMSPPPSSAPQAPAAPWNTPQQPAASWQTPQPPVGQAPAMAAPAPAMAAPAAAAPKSPGGGRFGAFIGLLGGVAIMVGSFLAWMKIVPTGGSTYLIRGWDLSDDAKITVAIGAVAVLLAFVVLLGTGRRLVRLLFALAGIAALAVAGYDSYDILKRVPKRADILAAYPQGAEITGPWIGLWLIIGGGVLLLLGALVMKAKRTAAQTPAGYTPIQSPR